MPLWERLKYAREKADLTLSEVAQATGIGESSLSEFENQHREPRLSQVQSLANLYHRSLAFLMSEAPLPVETVLWRDKPSPEMAAKIGGTFLHLCEQYHHLETWLDERVVCNLPSESGDPKSFSFPHAESLAHRVHGELGLGDRPGQSLLVILEELCGVKVFHLPLEQGSAACTHSEAFGAAILLNSGHVRWRRNFDLAHELFHLLTWNVFRSSESGENPTAPETEESLANTFASNLLMPADAVKSELDERIKDDKISFSDMFDTARQFDVSVEALCWRMKSLRYFEKSDQVKETITRYRKSASLWESNRVLDEPPTRPERFRALAVRALRQGELSQGRFAEYLGISRREAGSYVEQDAREDEKVSITPA